jgi:hypothetical protein
MTKGRQPGFRVVQRDLPPFETEDQAIKDARETLGIVDEEKG